MKLSPIDIEKALELSVAAPPVPTQGPVETCLRHALAALGPRGERWTKGRMVCWVGAQMLRRIKPLPNALRYTDLESLETTVEFEEIRLGEYAYCVLGTITRTVIDQYPHRATDILDQIEMDARVVATFITATGIHPIAKWNDAPERTFAEVKAAFERAISYAKHNGL